jgi:hypothetical protein
MADLRTISARLVNIYLFILGEATMFLRSPLCIALLIGSIALPAQATPVGGNTDDCRIPGAVVHEHNFFGVDKRFIVNFTDKRNGGQIVASVDAGVIGAGKTVTVGVPPAAANLDHCDVINHSLALDGGERGGPGNVRGGAQQQLKIEALTKDAQTGVVKLGSIFDFVFQAYGRETIFMPDLWADTTGDGVIADGDLLYSLIDLRAYTHGGADALAAVNARFSAGQSFEIINGVVVGLDGMWFSSTAFTFDEVAGYQGNAFNGTGYTATNHGIAVISEPAGLGLLLLALGLAFKARRSTKEPASGNAV